MSKLKYTSFIEYLTCSIQFAILEPSVGVGGVIVSAHCLKLLHPIQSAGRQSAPKLIALRRKNKACLVIVSGGVRLN